MYLLRLIEFLETSNYIMIDIKLDNPNEVIKKEYKEASDEIKERFNKALEKYIKELKVKTILLHKFLNENVSIDTIEKLSTLLELSIFKGRAGDKLIVSALKMKYPDLLHTIDYLRLYSKLWDNLGIIGNKSLSILKTNGFKGMSDFRENENIESFFKENKNSFRETRKYMDEVIAINDNNLKDITSQMMEYIVQFGVPLHKKSIGILKKTVFSDDYNKLIENEYNEIKSKEVKTVVKIKRKINFDI